MGDLVNLRFFGEDSAKLKGAVLSWLPSDVKSLSVPIAQGCRGKVTRNGGAARYEERECVCERGTTTTKPTKQQSERGVKGRVERKQNVGRWILVCP